MFTPALVSQILLGILLMMLGSVFGPCLLSAIATAFRSVVVGLFVGSFATDKDFNPACANDKQAFCFEPLYVGDGSVRFRVREKDTDGAWGDCEEVFGFGSLFLSRNRVAKFYRDLPHHNRRRPADIKGWGVEVSVLGSRSICELDAAYCGPRSEFGRTLEAMRDELRGSK